MLTATPNAKSPASRSRSRRAASNASHSASDGLGSVLTGGVPGNAVVVGAAPPGGSVVVVVPVDVSPVVGAVVGPTVATSSGASTGGPGPASVVLGRAFGRDALQPATATSATTATIACATQRRYRTHMGSIMVALGPSGRSPS